MQDTPVTTREQIDEIIICGRLPLKQDGTVDLYKVLRLLQTPLPNAQRIDILARVLNHRNSNPAAARVKEVIAKLKSSSEPTHRVSNLSAHFLKGGGCITLLDFPNVGTRTPETVFAMDAEGEVKEFSVTTHFMLALQDFMRAQSLQVVRGIQVRGNTSTPRKGAPLRRVDWIFYSHKNDVDAGNWDGDDSDGEDWDGTDWDGNEK